MKEELKVEYYLEQYGQKLRLLKEVHEFVKISVLYT